MINIDDRILETLEPNELWLLIHIVKRLNKEHTAFPSKRTLLNDTRWKSEKTLRAALDALVAKNILSISTRTREDGSQTSNLYRVTTALIGVYKPANELQEMVKDTVGGVQKMQGGEVQKIHPRGVQKMQGGRGKKCTPNEVLSNQVLDNEVLNNEASFSENKFSDAVNEFYENGEPLPTKQPETPTPPKLRAAPPKADKAPNQVYQLFEAYAKFCEGKGIPMSRNANGNFEMSGKDAKAISTWVKWAKGMPGAGDPLNDWTVYLDAAWTHGDKFIKANFTPTILQTKSLSIVYAVNKHRIAQKELHDAVMQGSGIDDLLNP